MSRLEAGFRDVDAAGDVESYADYLSHVNGLAPVLLEKVGVAAGLSDDQLDGVALEVHLLDLGGSEERHAGGGLGEAADVVVDEEARGVGLCLSEHHGQARESGSHERDGEALLGDAVQREADRGQGAPIEVLHLVEQEQRPGAARAGDLPDLHEQVGEVLRDIAADAYPVYSGTGSGWGAGSVFMPGIGPAWGLRAEKAVSSGRHPIDLSQ
ncbi:MAG: hypothetical protein ACHQE6_04380, partial [Solirubrobacterales bacterium]